MKRRPDRERKLEILLKYYGNKCPCCNKPFTKKITALERFVYPELNDADIINLYKPELHHRCHNHDINNDKYPKFLHSIYNLIPLHTKCHTENRNFRNIPDEMAERIERMLSERLFATDEIDEEIMNIVNGGMYDYLQNTNRS